MAKTKEELPLCSDQEVAKLVHQFEHCELAHKNWTHRAHLAVAVSYSREMDFEQALNRLRKNINLYNHRCGDPSGYNETITIVFLRKIYSELNQNHHRKAIHEQAIHKEVSRLSKACSVDWLYEYFSPELIWSEKAKAQWIEPDIREIDF